MPSAEATAAAVAAVPEWFHSIDVGCSVITPGRKSATQLADELGHLQLGDLTGLTVLDIGANDGYFSFAAEERGASRVVALDYFTWCSDPVLRARDWQESKALGCLPATERPGLWRPDTKPGKVAFDTARRLRSSRVQDVVGNFMKLDLCELGIFDLVFFLGVLYHLDDPFSGLQRLARVTRGSAYIETAAGIVVAGHEDQTLVEFYPGAELDQDHTNWWAPSLPALDGMCRAAGFSRTIPLATPLPQLRRGIERCRLTIRADK